MTVHFRTNFREFLMIVKLSLFQRKLIISKNIDAFSDMFLNVAPMSGRLLMWVRT